MTNILTQAGLTQEALKALSDRFDEPNWLREKRQHAFERYEALGIPQTRYTKIRSLDLNSFLPYSEASELDLSKAPSIVSELIEAKTDADAYGIQIDSSIHQWQVAEELKSKGVIFCDLHTAVKEHGELVQKYLMQDLFKLQIKFEAMHAAFWSGGVFVYVPKNVELETPLHMLNLHQGQQAGMFNHILIVAEQGSRMTFMEENYALNRDAVALHTGGVEVWAMDGAHVQIGSIQNWNEKTYSFGTRRGRAHKDASVDWTLGWLGGRLTMSHLSNELAGAGAAAYDVQMSYSHRKQHFDISSNLVHQVPDTNGEVRVRNVLRDKSRSVFSGLIRIEPGAQRSNAYQSQRALILNPGARNDASPSLEINANDVRCTHAASASQLDDERLFYLRSRGLDEDQAKKAIVDGFFQPTVDNINMPVARERLERLIDEKWEKDET